MSDHEFTLLQFQRPGPACLLTKGVVLNTDQLCIYVTLYILEYQIRGTTFSKIIHYF